MMTFTPTPSMISSRGLLRRYGAVTRACPQRPLSGTAILPQDGKPILALLLIGNG